jgi:hypothetical protein
VLQLDHRTGIGEADQLLRGPQVGPHDTVHQAAQGLLHIPQAALGGGVGQHHQPLHVLGDVLHRPGQLSPRLLDLLGRLLGELAPALGGRLRAAARDLARGLAGPAGRLGAGLGGAAHGVAAGAQGLYGLRAAALPLIRRLLMLGVGHVWLYPSQNGLLKG